MARFDGMMATAYNKVKDQLKKGDIKLKLDLFSGNLISEDISEFTFSNKNASEIIFIKKEAF